MIFFILGTVVGYVMGEKEEVAVIITFVGIYISAIRYLIYKYNLGMNNYRIEFLEFHEKAIFFFTGVMAVASITIFPSIFYAKAKDEVLSVGIFMSVGFNIFITIVLNRWWSDRATRVKQIKEGLEQKRGKEETNGVYVVKNNTRVKIATFSDGNVFGTNLGGEKFNIGRYDREGKVYNSDGNMIGFMMGTRMFISREFWFDFFRKQYSFELNKPELIFYLGEVLGGMSGTIFEADMDGRNRYENEVAYYETIENELIGVGATYLLLLYEGMINSPHSVEFKMKPEEVLK